MALQLDVADIQEAVRYRSEELRAFHMLRYPTSHNLQALMLIILADLEQNQREALTQTLFQRKLSLMDATSDQITDIISILSCAPRSSLDNPSYSHAQKNAPRTFLVLQQGDCFGSSGAWCEDDETGEEGFVADMADTFGLPEEIRRRTMRKGQSKGRGKGKGKGKSGKGKGCSGRPFFKPYFK
eukprot:2338961-Amphidinium_carterae.1